MTDHFIFGFNFSYQQLLTEKIYAWRTLNDMEKYVNQTMSESTKCKSMPFIVDDILIEYALYLFVDLYSFIALAHLQFQCSFAYLLLLFFESILL